MAPVGRADHNALEQQLKDIIQDLYQVMIQVSTYDAMGRPSKDVLANEIKTLSQSLERVHATASSPSSTFPMVPPELVQYVEDGRNPDIYTREFVELVRRGNQLMKGKQAAFGAFRDVLAEQMNMAMPELRDDVARVVAATGGAAGAASGSASAAAAVGSSSSATGAGAGLDANGMAVAGPSGTS